MDLFDRAHGQTDFLAPLADRLRPRLLDEVKGQEHLLGPGRILRKAIEQDMMPSAILWGPPGSGKTTLAVLIAKYTGADFRSYSAVTSGMKELKEVLVGAQELMKYHRRRSILFIDEIHRFNKAQQDAFLPYVERGDIILVGATTENPSFEINAALLSRCQVYVLNSLAPAHLLEILRRALQEPGRGLGEKQLAADEEALAYLARKANGDARTALNGLELAAALAGEAGTRLISLALAEEALQQKAARYDKTGEGHYNLISALHKSIRGSDPDAALYWLGRMLEAGEDPHFLLRRMARMACEDIGLADPNALLMAAGAQQAFDCVGLPEGKLALAELAVYLSLAPKSNALETGYLRVQEEVKKQADLEVPLYLRNAPTRLMKNLDYGRGYRYAHDFNRHWVAEDYLPENLRGQRFYSPGTLGWEGKQLPEIEERIRRREEARPAPGERPVKPEED
ncbi:replication-associated recombination protein A [candidate division FCPU426 bacterium]|nr:replication-associated recombination protein A [candidate division FCPU426 bacterium]